MLFHAHTKRPFVACLRWFFIIVVATVSMAALRGADEPAPAPSSTTRTLAAFVTAAKARHPTAQAVAAAQRAAHARAAQASVWANPEIELSYGRTRPRIDDLDRDHPYGGRISQRMEWWSKRDARVAVANAQIALSDAEAAAALLELEVDVRLAAIALASAQAATRQADVQATLAQELATIVTQRQTLGDIDAGQAARIRLEATTARLRHDAAVRTEALYLTVLRGWCDETLPADVIISDALVDPLSNDDLISSSPGIHPQVQAAIEAEHAAEARVTAERHARLPDVTVGVFGDREHDKDTIGVSLGLEIPLWDRNAAGIAEADAERAQRAAQRAVAVQTLERERTTAIGMRKAAALEVIALRDQAAPIAEDAVRLRTLALSAGDASVAEVLEARRAASAVQDDLLAARRRYAEAQVRVLAVTTTHPETGAGERP